MKKSKSTAKKTVKKTVAKKAVKKTLAKKTAPRKAAPQMKTAVKKTAKPNDAGGKLSAQELASIAATLAEMKRDIAKHVEDKKNLDMVEPDGGDSIDLATRSLDKEILFELSDNERKMLGDIEAALRKMENHTYGLCEHCKNGIEKKRIKALPSARYCITCQSGTELRRRE